MGSILKSLDETQLRTLKFSEFTGREPFVLKDVDTKLERGIGLKQQISRRADDLVRITKLLASGPGLKFVGHNALLAFSENQKTNKKFKLSNVVQAGKSVASTLATILAQVPVSGTGIHFSADELAGTTYYESKSTTKLKNSNGIFVKGDEGQEKTLVKESELTQIKTFTVRNPELEGKEYLQRTQEQLQTIRQLVDIDTRSSKNIDAFLKMGGTQKDRKDRGTQLSKDEKNFLSVQTESVSNGTDADIIPFKIVIKTANADKNYYLYFRAYLEDLSDNFRGEWNSSKYIGRAEPFYNYTGFDRSLGFSFKLAATSRAELIPLYQKLNYLAGSTSPTYLGSTTVAEDEVSGPFMSGNYVVLTIGDYVVDLPGFFESVDITWDKSYPWEIKRGRPGEQNVLTDEESIIAVPHILDVRVSFKPIHDFAPQLEESFISRFNVASPPEPVF